MSRRDVINLDDTDNETDEDVVEEYTAEDLAFIDTRTTEEILLDGDGEEKDESELLSQEVDPGNILNYRRPRRPRNLALPVDDIPDVVDRVLDPDYEPSEDEESSEAEEESGEDDTDTDMTSVL